MSEGTKRTKSTYQAYPFFLDLVVDLVRVGTTSGAYAYTMNPSPCCPGPG